MANTLEQLLAVHACHALVLASVDAVDRQDYAALAHLFTPDGVLVRPDGQPIAGPAAILATYAARSPDRLTRHLVSNHRVQVSLLAGSATSVCTILLWSGKHSDARTPRGRPADELQQIGEIEDQLVQTPEGWRIAQRNASFSLFRPV